MRNKENLDIEDVNNVDETLVEVAETDKDTLTPKVIIKTLLMAVSALILLLFLILKINKTVDTRFITIVIFVSSTVSFFILFIQMFNLSKKVVKLYSELVDFLLTLNVVFISALIILCFIFTTAVEGYSMEPSLHNKNRVLSLNLRKPKRFDIVALQVNSKYNPNAGASAINEDLYVKRVIGMPGDQLYFEDGLLYLNGEYVEESYLLDDEGEFIFRFEGINTKTSNFSFADITVKGKKIFNEEGPYIIPADYYFVMGDNRGYSRDSRDIGLFHKSQIIGIVRYQRVGFLKWVKV